MMGFHLSDVWAWLRYFPAFSNHQQLRLREEWSSIDLHQKTVSSGDFGVGFSTWVLAAHLGFDDFADVLHVVNVLDPQRFRLRRSARRGPSKSPDYIAYGPGQAISVLECKGSQSSHRRISSAVASGITQKANLQPRGFVLHSSLVCGVFVPQWESTEDAMVLVADPADSDPKAMLSGYPRDDIGRAGFTASLAADLALINMPSTARAWIGGTPSQDKLAGALREDLARVSTARPEPDHEAVVFRREHRWLSPVSVDGVPVGGIRLSGHIPPDLVDEIRAADVEGYADRRWMEKGRSKYQERWDAMSLVLPARTGILFALTLLPL
jgi:hypothetical protein